MQSSIEWIGDTFAIKSALLKVGLMGQFLGDLCADVCPVPSQNVVFRDANGDQSLKGSLVRCICCRISPSPAPSDQARRAECAPVLPAESNAPSG